MHHSSHSSSYPGTNLPRTLQRPPLPRVPAESIGAIAPELAGVPVEYVKRHLASNARQMLAGSASLSIPSPTKGHLPAYLSVGCRPSRGATYPTHLLAIGCSKVNAHADQTMMFVPTHAIVLAAHCSRTPPLDATVSHPSEDKLRLRIVRMMIPSPAAFSILHNYMYNLRPDGVVHALLPRLPANMISSLRTQEAIRATLGSGTTKHQLASALAHGASYNLSHLTSCAAHAKEMWHDMVSLGMNDALLWDTLDLCWEIILAALNLAFSRQ
ncbi:clp1-like protein [Schizophyllum commune H4-8]|uniref:Clp1-like protein n=1 Tax=Schizophyllum commune (strain H4-8 / FGSC 9210) TaxID=578458 RepID=D8PXG3_SCHCM|nr:clp1-like protein [Schizophyllum commune H4-8]KAI5896904.1 clp1-like protein [Schizophyllum commune H4-8]